jgi:hypothetical protein
LWFSGSALALKEVRVHVERSGVKPSRTLGSRADSFVDHRYILLAAGAAYFWLGGLWLSGGSSGDWGYFINAAHSLSHVSNVGVYAGPFALLLALPFKAMSVRASWIVCSGLCMALAVVSIRWLETAADHAGAGTPRARQRAVLVGGLFGLYALSQPGVLAGHADDVLALAAVALAVRFVAFERWVLAAVAIGVAIDCKPWAGLLVPLAAACGGARVRGIVVAVGSALLIALPFLAIQHSAIDVGSVNLPVEAGSGAHYLGAAIGATPGWPRALQIALALPLGMYAVTRGRFYLVPIIALAIRVNLDPATTWYYQAGPVFAAFVWDAFRPLKLSGLRTALTCVAVLLIPKDVNLLHLGHGAAPSVLAAVLRLAVLVASVAGVAWGQPWRRPRPTLRPQPA